jgi:hypothetical protein
MPEASKATASPTVEMEGMSSHLRSRSMYRWRVTASSRAPLRAVPRLPLAARGRLRAGAVWRRHIARGDGE